MELKEFVKQTLRDLVEGVEECRKESTRDMHLSMTRDNRSVEFDIAVTIENNTTGSGGANIRILEVIGGGGEVSKEVKNSTINRIKFGVNVHALTDRKNSNVNIKKPGNPAR